jgi:hypothetical protein
MRWLLLIPFFLLCPIGYAVSQTSAEIIRSLMPPDEAAFITAVENAKVQYNSALNNLAKGVARPERKRAICSILTTRNIRNWVGILDVLDSNGDGKGVLSASIAPNIYLKTWNNDLSDIGSDTLIDPSSALYAHALKLHEGQAVAFSGSFFPDDVDCVKETSMTLGGSLTEPEYLLKFSDISEAQVIRNNAPDTTPITIAPGALHTPDKPAAAPATSPPDDPALVQAQNMATFVSSYFAAGSTGNIDDMRKYYANSVMYFGKKMSIDNIIDEKKRFVKRWPIRDYAIRHGSVRVKCTDICTVVGVVDWNVKSLDRDATTFGSAAFTFNIVPINSAIGGVIIFEDSTVTTRNSSQLTGVPPAK